MAARVLVHVSVPNGVGCDSVETTLLTTYLVADGGHMIDTSCIRLARK